MSSIRAFFLKFLPKGKVQKTNTIADQVNFVAKIIAGNYAAIHTSRQTLILGRFSSWKFQEKKLIEKVGHSCLLLLKKTVSEGNLRQFNVIYSRYSPRAGYELIAESVFTEPFSSGDEDLALGTRVVGFLILKGYTPRVSKENFFVHKVNQYRNNEKRTGITEINIWVYKGRK